MYVCIIFPQINMISYFRNEYFPFPKDIFLHIVPGSCQKQRNTADCLSTDLRQIVYCRPLGNYNLTQLNRKRVFDKGEYFVRYRPILFHNAMLSM